MQTLVQLLLQRVVPRLCTRDVKPRVLMGDCIFQWIGDSLRDSGPLQGAVTWFCRRVFRLGLVLEVSTSGFVSSTVRVAAKLAPLARVMGPPGKKRM
eukprot:5308202-Pyramimonas_sp.AAC.1